MMQNPGADNLIKAVSSSAARSTGSSCTSRLSRRYFRLRSRVLRTLIALKSIPVTRASGQRSACLAACEVPQPAIRIE